MIGILFLDKKKSPPFSVGMIISALTIELHGLFYVGTITRVVVSVVWHVCINMFRRTRVWTIKKKLMGLFFSFVDLVILTSGCVYVCKSV